MFVIYAYLNIKHCEVYCRSMEVVKMNCLAAGTDGGIGLEIMCVGMMAHVSREINGLQHKHYTGDY